MNSKKFTGERLETIIKTEVAIEHLHRYALTLNYIKNKTVLDIASGEGYGSNLMAKTAAEVIGVDISGEAIAAAKLKYRRDNLKFVTGTTSQIPCPEEYFDVVVSFETIEHHDQHEQMLSEIKRVLKPGGLIFISSPDKLYYTDKRKHHNKYHVKELYENEFKELIKCNFQHCQFLYQRSTFVSLLVPESGQHYFEEFKGDYDAIIKNEEFEQMYILAIASAVTLPDVPLSIFKDDVMIERLMTENIGNVRKTVSYKIGHGLLYPVKLFKKIFA